MKPKLLLIDDEEGIRTVLGLYLEDGGYQVLTAASGEEGLALFRREQPPIVLTDIKMPGMGGVELLRRIKQMSPDTEVIMITGHGDLELAIQSLKHQATDFITKPINEDVLEIALQRARERMDMRQRLRSYTENLESLVRQKSARLVEAERQLAVRQVVDGLNDSLKNLGDHFRRGLPFLNELPCFVAIHDRGLKVVAANQLYGRRLGKGPGDPSWSMYDLGGEDPRSCPAGRTLQTGQPQSCRETMVCRDGSLLPVMVHTAPIKNSRDQVELVLEMAADITEVKRLQERLRVTQQKYLHLFEEVPCYISVQDRRFRITEVNRRFREDFGDHIGAHCYQVYRHRDQPCPRCPLVQTFRDGRTHQVETVVTAASGEQYNVLVHTTPILDARGRISHGMEMSTNITQIRRLQDHLGSLGLLLGSTAHGIKGMLTALDGGVYRVGTGLARKRWDQVEEGFGVIESMVERIKKMVLDILYYAKPRELDWKSVAARELAEQAAALIEPRLEGTGIRLLRRFHPGSGRFEVDAGALLPALVNILENAVDACTEDPEPGDHTIEFVVRGEARRVILEIRDDGVGMDQKTREKLFTLFFSSKGSRGTGIGLFVANQVVQQHGGSLRVESRPGRGSRFLLSLPRRLPESAKLPPPEGLPPPLS